MSEAELKKRTIALCDAVSKWRGNLPVALEGANFVDAFETDVLDQALSLWDALEPGEDHAAGVQS